MWGGDGAQARSPEGLAQWGPPTPLCGAQVHQDGGGAEGWPWPRGSGRGRRWTAVHQPPSGLEVIRECRAPRRAGKRKAALARPGYWGPTGVRAGGGGSLQRRLHTSSHALVSSLPPVSHFSHFVFYNFPFFLTDFSTKFDSVSTLLLGKLH